MGYDVRCKQCSKAERFRATRGSRLKQSKCSCGGSFERIKEKRFEGKNPIFPESTHRFPGATFHFLYFSPHGKFAYDTTANKYVLIEKFDPKDKSPKIRKNFTLQETGFIPLSTYVNTRLTRVDHSCQKGDKIEWKRNGSRGGVCAVILGWSEDKQGYVFVQNYTFGWLAPSDKKSKVWIKTRSVLRILKYQS